MDGLYAKRNGEIANKKDLDAFQQAVNAEMENLNSGFREISGEHGAKMNNKEVQKAYQHGFSLNIPQEYGSRNDALNPGGRMGIEVFDWIESKMKKGTGEAFSFKFDPKEGKLAINENVDVNAAIKEHEDFYENFLFNPKAAGSGKFDQVLYEQRQAQISRDGRAPKTMFPSTFYGHNYGEGVK